MVRRRDRSVAGRVFGLQVLAALLVALVLTVVLAVDARRAVGDDAARVSLAVASTIAADPAVREALQEPDPSARLQPYALAAITAAEVDFVTVMSPEGLRYTHPDPAQIGRPFLGTIAGAVAGGTVTETYTGTLGPSVRAVVPVLDDAGVIGLVAAGVTTREISEDLAPRIPFVIAVGLVVIAVGAIAAALTRRSLRRSTGDLDAEGMRTMVRFYESVLHAVREGVVLTDDRGRVVLYNDEAAELLGIEAAGEHPAPRKPAELGIDAGIAALLTTGRRVVEESHVAGARVLLLNQESAPGAPSDGGRSPAVMTMRDQSVLQELVGELESVRTVSEALRAQAHEHANTLHTVLSLVEMGRGDEVAGLVGESVRASQGLVDATLVPDEDPVLTAVLLGKAAIASERGAALELDREEGVALPLSPSDTVSLVGNLVDNALEACLRGAPPHRVVVRLDRVNEGVRLAVADSGPGVAPEIAERVFDAGVSTKTDAGPGHGLGLAAVRGIVERAGGAVAFRPRRPTTVDVILPEARS
ncbi:ATP-binding protein [Microcella daejeonensis]|uniref:histidine kinase n=1 Tax=Microcella daejeonensis TaxID=2994971 RepID=A0A9E8S8R6_9MICO|nr:ATP-binding protein [Microcella daejeonensis]WAB81548.1 ATP-binding protein [Microcella daejeonensis]